MRDKKTDEAGKIKREVAKIKESIPLLEEE